MQDVVIYEPIYREGQQLSQPLFRPLPIANDRPDWRELQIFVDMYRAGLHRQQALTGMLSPKFELKAGYRRPVRLRLHREASGRRRLPLQPRQPPRLSRLQHVDPG